MNKKQLFTEVCLILGSLIFTDSVLAQPDPNYQSVKQCPATIIAAANVTLTNNTPNFRLNDNATPLVLGDDFYQLCNVDFTICQTFNVPAARGLTIIGSNGPNVIQGTPYNDRICGMNGDDIINGGEGNDRIFGNNGSDELSGGLGNDLIYGGNGNDILFGYDEEEDLLMNNTPHDDLLTSDLAFKLAIPYPLTLPVDNDTLWGGNGHDQLFGGPDADSLAGENGKDHLDGGDGIDAIDGGRAKDSCEDLNGDCASATNL